MLALVKTELDAHGQNDFAKPHLHSVQSTLSALKHEARGKERVVFLFHLDGVVVVGVGVVVGGVGVGGGGVVPKK